MNEWNLNEGQWEDRKQWSLGVGQRRTTFWNRYTYIHTYINIDNSLQTINRLVFKWTRIMFSVRQGMNCYVFIDINLRLQRVGLIPVSVRIQRNKLSGATAGLARLLLLFCTFSCRQLKQRLPCVESMSLCPSFCLCVTYYQHV